MQIPANLLCFKNLIKMNQLKIAIQKSGRLSEKSLELISEAGISLNNSDRKLITRASNFPIEILFLRDDVFLSMLRMGLLISELLEKM